MTLNELSSNYAEGELDRLHERYPETVPLPVLMAAIKLAYIQGALEAAKHFPESGNLREK